MCAQHNSSESNHNASNNDKGSNRNGWGAQEVSNRSNNAQQGPNRNGWGARANSNQSNNDQGPNRNGWGASEGGSNASTARIRNNNNHQWHNSDVSMAGSMVSRNRNNFSPNESFRNKRKTRVPSVRTKASKKDVDSHVKCCLRYIQQFLKKSLVQHRRPIVSFCFDPRNRVTRPPHIEIACFINTHIPEIRNHPNYSIYIAQTIDNAIHTLHFGGTVHRNFCPGKRGK